MCHFIFVRRMGCKNEKQDVSKKACHPALREEYRLSVLKNRVLRSSTKAG
jgi:hypothetical protein